MPWIGKAWIDGARNAAAPNSHYTADPQITASDATNAARLAGEGFVAVPTSNWTAGQAMYVGGYAFYWNGSAWVAGTHP